MLERLGEAYRLLNYTRAFSLGFAGLLALLVLMNAAPNMLSGGSRRAIINAPVTIVTSPIPGRILDEPVGQGQKARLGDVLARVENVTVDRSELMRLKLETLSVEEKLLVTKTQIDQNRIRADELGGCVANFKSETIRQLNESMAEAQAKAASARATADSRLNHSRRIRPLLQSHTFTPFHIQAADLSAAAANADSSAAEHMLAFKSSVLEAGKKGYFVGDSFMLLNNLQQQLISLEADIKKLEAEQQAGQQRSSALKVLTDAEEARVRHLADAVVTAPADGFVIDFDRLPGQYVDAGGKILRTASCKTAIATAVFPLSMVGDLTVDAPMSVELIEEGRRVAGRISRILPRDADRESEKLWVPLPPAQTNEVYVLVALDEPLSQGGDTKDCSIGSWVRVSSVSPLMRMMSRTAGATFSGLGSIFGISVARAQVEAKVVTAAGARR